MKEKVSLSTLFFTFLKINTFTFGGGYTIVPIIRDEFVYGKELIEDEDMLDIVALAQSGPGAMAISTSLLTGYKLRGPLGAFVCMFASILPCLIIITVISRFYQSFRDNFFVNAALAGISGIISAVLLVTVFNMGKAAMKKNRIFSIFTMIFSFVLAYFTTINTGLIILLLGFMGIIKNAVTEGGIR